MRNPLWKKRPAVRATVPVRVARATPPAAAPPTEPLAPPPRATSPAAVPEVTVPSVPAASRQLTPLIGGVGALVLAGTGEALVAAGNTSPLSLLLYLVAIGLFAWSAKASSPVASPEPASAAEVSSRAGTRRTWMILGGGTALALVLDGVALALIKADLRSAPGAWLWAASLVVLLVAGLLVRRQDGWAPRWVAGFRPSTRRGWALVAAGGAGILVVAALLRFVGLDQVPFGINADEGDRAATAIQVLRGTNTESIFGTGWYRIAMFYFWLLAGWMQVLGTGFVQARMFGALASLITVGVVTWIGIRHISVRVGLLAGALLATLGVALQFARETSEAGPTAMLWTISVALFLEGARGGRAWAWIGAGLAGGFALYFYPSGRLWGVLAAAFCVYLLIHGLGGQRRGILRGAALAAIASLLVMSPFLLNGLTHPEIITLRAEETSIFSNNNAARLHYYEPTMSTAELLEQQMIHAVGVFNQFHDDAAFYPSDRPIMAGPLAVLTLLGLGWACLRWRDPRFVALALWFWVGFVGVIITVETPNVQRMATAVPVLALFSALTLDSLAARITDARAAAQARPSRRLAWAGTALAGLITLGLMSNEAGFYFGTYGATDRWPIPSNQGKAIAAQGPDTLVVTLGQQWHMVNSGWVRLLALTTPRGGLQAPGSDLPLAIAPANDLAFMIFPRQDYYLPYLRDLYPGGRVISYTHPVEGLMFTMYGVSREQWAATQGALAVPPRGAAVPVDTLGAPPAGWNVYPSPMRWTAGLRVPQYGNYAVRIGPGPATLTIDGQPVLTVPSGTAVLSATLALAQGDHGLRYDGTMAAPNTPARFEWAPVPRGVEPGADLEWHPAAHEELIRDQVMAVGLYGVVDQPDRPATLRLDRTLATCCLSDATKADRHPYTITWTGAITAPVSGVYSMTLRTQGEAR
ncbi:MAG TPA: glycosyltransferase family 39 protein, partial [Chloroflexia bacterium]|nr:glycosyltransferase family 39 protein [Chloroflexia bacterium]